MTENNTSWERRMKALPRPVKAAFFASLILGFAVHLFAFTNLIPNSDGLSRMFDAQQMTVSGRWFLHYASMLHGFLQAPALIGILSLLLLSVSAAMTADLLELRHTSAGIAVGAAYVTIPALAYTYLYMFTASAYALAVLMAVASVWLLRKKRHGFFPAVLLLACSLGTYQAYFAMAAGLALMRVLLDLLDTEKPVKQTVREGFRALGMLALGAAAYALILFVFLKVKDLELLDYRGISDAGTGGSIRQMLLSLFSAAKQLGVYFLVPGGAFASPGLTIANGIFLLLGGAAGVSIVIRRRLREEPVRLALLFLGLLLLPPACNFTRVISAMSPNMCYSFLLVYVFGTVLLDRAELPGGLMVPKAAAVAFALIVLVNSQLCNLVYTSSLTAHRATEVFASNLVSRVEQTPGYRSDLEVVIIGAFPRQVYHTSSGMFRPVEHYSCLSDTVMQSNKHVYYYLNDWLNIPWQAPEEETMIAVSDSEVFRNMPLYPDDGSVRIEGERVIVKLAPRYIPKAPYEIAYENRR